MKIIDLSLPIYSGMPVYPGDPEVEVEQLQTLEKDGWNMKRMHISLHDGTHVNAPIHATVDGPTLDTNSIDNFIGKTRLFKTSDDIVTSLGVIFGDQNVSWENAKLIVEKKPKFVGLSHKFEFDIEIEKFLLEKHIISFENLANTEKLPDEFEFYGVPLNIKAGDGSPVRAFAICK